MGYLASHDLNRYHMIGREDADCPPQDHRDFDFSTQDAGFHNAGVHPAMRRYLLQKDDPFINRGHMDLAMVTRAVFDANEGWNTPIENFAPDRDMPHPGYSPPYYSGLPSTCSSSILSDEPSPPFTSPEVAIIPYSPPYQHCDLLFYSSGTPQSEVDCTYAGMQPCVAMTNVQRYADAQPDPAAYEDAHCYGAQMPQEGFLPISETVEFGAGHCPDEAFDQYQESRGSTEALVPPMIRRRQTTGVRGRVADRTTSRTKKRSLTPEPDSQAEDSPASASAAIRAFPCPLAPYGCTSSFTAKNEWKRHANTQHFRLGYWRCDQCHETGKKPNDFNRKDLFVQHFRRMHLTHKLTPAKKARTGKANKDLAVEEILSQAAERCYKVLRQAPMHSCCVVCPERFEGPGSFDQRLEHIGRHMEDARKEGKEPEEVTAWTIDEETECWLLEHRVLVKIGRRLILA